MENITYKFLLDCIKSSINENINDNIKRIINVDETPCYLENPTSETIDIKGKKNIEIPLMTK